MKNQLLKESHSFKASARGVYFFFRHERHASIHFIATVVALVVSWWLNINYLEWIVVILCITVVIVSEIINTCIELTCDLITMENNIHIRQIKDMAAGAVLLASTCSVIVGCIIFIPKLLAVI